MSLITILFAKFNSYSVLCDNKRDDWLKRSKNNVHKDELKNLQKTVPEENKPSKTILPHLVGEQLLVFGF